MQRTKQVGTPRQTSSESRRTSIYIHLPYYTCGLYNKYIWWVLELAASYLSTSPVHHPHPYLPFLIFYRNTCQRNTLLLCPLLKMVRETTTLEYVRVQIQQFDAEKRNRNPVTLEAREIQSAALTFASKTDGLHATTSQLTSAPLLNTKRTSTSSTAFSRKMADSTSLPNPKPHLRLNPGHP